MEKYLGQRFISVQDSMTLNPDVVSLNLLCIKLSIVYDLPSDSGSRYDSGRPGKTQVILDLKCHQTQRAGVLSPVRPPPSFSCFKVQSVFCAGKGRVKTRYPSLFLLRVGVTGGWVGWKEGCEASSVEFIPVRPKNS